ncbi:hypothetical protein EVAR_55281_1 [Eumeta japonica]|uniref:Uncharacterized protein n=1 Tax=Eumeta variegata TaxID=151549 RepID=A0A4C1ZGW9_EUMVA|nr:hypothetical protein EVAR_55281_1 [Eumeta japonica]
MYATLKGIYRYYVPISVTAKTPEIISMTLKKVLVSWKGSLGLYLDRDYSDPKDAACNSAKSFTKELTKL